MILRNSVGRKEKTGERVAALFSGYQAPKSCIQRAVRRANLDIDDATSWSSFDIHRVVAHYLTIRFPICLALNKVDMLPEEADGSLVVAECSRIANLQGEVAVPVSARAESWILLKLAAAFNKESSMAHLLPSEGSPAWIDNERCVAMVTNLYGGTGVLECVSAAVALRPPILCYPVSDVETEAPVGWSSSLKSTPAARDCLQFKPGSTVEDVYLALKSGALEHAILSGEFVRAEGKSLDTGSKKKQVGRDAILDTTFNVLRIQTNRKVVWQNGAKGS